MCEVFFYVQSDLELYYYILLNLWADQELDIIEMAVYGDVIRPGK
jgi:hypothetical protein